MSLHEPTFQHRDQIRESFLTRICRTTSRTPLDAGEGDLVQRRPGPLMTALKPGRCLHAKKFPDVEVAKGCDAIWVRTLRDHRRASIIYLDVLIVLLWPGEIKRQMRNMRKQARKLSETVDKRGNVSGSEAVINVHHRDV